MSFFSLSPVSSTRGRTALRAWLLLIACALATSIASPGRAEDDSQAFIREQHRKIEALLHEAVSPSRDARINDALNAFVDYDELTHRAFGEPCPRSEPSCEDLWTGYNDAQRAELRDLIEQLVRKTYRRNLTKTLDWDVDYRGERDSAGDAKVLTEAKNRAKPRDPSVRVDYIVKMTTGGPKVVDIITEGSSMTKNYYDQFRRKMHNTGEGYPNIVQKLREKIAKKD